MKLVLFDIDGTILKSQGAGRSAVQEALESVCGPKVTSDGVSFAGRTDPEIMREMLSMAGLSPVEQENLIEECLETYVSVLMRRLKPNMVAALPGVRRLIAILEARTDVFLGLLTGNLKETAYLKLHAVGLGSHFPFGAFGSDKEDRYDLPGIAVERAFKSTGIRFRAHQTVIIGDTPHDIGCATKYGAFSIGVCSGTYDRDQLGLCGADLLLDDLSDPEPILEQLNQLAAGA